MRTPNRLPRPVPVLLALLLATAAGAQSDAATMRERAAAAEAKVAAAVQDCLGALGAVRKAFGDPDNKLETDCRDIESALRGGSFEPGLGTVPIALDHLEYVAEERREATRAALGALRQTLAAGQLALLRHESLRELADRLEALGGLGADDDATIALADLAASATKATRSQALAAGDLARLQQDLARRRSRNEERVGAEQLGEAKRTLAQLRSELPAIEGELAAADEATRERGRSRLDEALQAIRVGAARARVDERKALLQELAGAAAKAEASYVRAIAGPLLARIRENWQFSADQFEGWADEVGESTAQGAIDLQPPNIDVFCLPKCVRLVDSAGKWFAFVGQDADFRRGQGAAEVAAYAREIADLRSKALAKLLPEVTRVLDGLPAIAIEEERIRNRMQTIADWEVPIGLLLHPDVPALRARVHALLDAHDRKTLGDERALATVREQALAAADAIWPRLQAVLPVEGGFEPATSSLFVGRTMRLEGVTLRTAEFAPGDHDVVFDLAGHVFVGGLAPAVRAAIARGRQRLGLAGDRLDSAEPCEFWAVVGDDAQAKLLGPKGAEDALPVPARRVQIVAARQGAVFGVAP